MTQVAQSQTPESLAADWLNEAATRRGLKGNFDVLHLRTDGHWLHFAVKLSSVREVSDRARILQEMEDEWDAHKPHSNWKLLLIPAAN